TSERTNRSAHQNKVFSTSSSQAVTPRRNEDMEGRSGAREGRDCAPGWRRQGCAGSREGDARRPEFMYRRADMTDTILSIAGVSKRYASGHQALNNINLEIRRGEI